MTMWLLLWLEFHLGKRMAFGVAVFGKRSAWKAGVPQAFCIISRLDLTFTKGYTRCGLGRGSGGHPPIFFMTITKS
jgi:hypothetical protein